MFSQGGEPRASRHPSNLITLRGLFAKVIHAFGPNAKARRRETVDGL